MAFNEKILKNLKPITRETALAMQAKSVESRKLNAAIREEMKLSAKHFKALMDELPKMSPLEVMEMAMQKAVMDGNYEDATRYASLMAPYTNPKLATIEQKFTNEIKDVSDEELQKIIAAEGLKLPQIEDLDE